MSESREPAALHLPTCCCAGWRNLAVCVAWVPCACNALGAVGGCCTQLHTTTLLPSAVVPTTPQQCPPGRSQVTRWAPSAASARETAKSWTTSACRAWATASPPRCRPSWPPVSAAALQQPCQLCRRACLAAGPPTKRVMGAWVQRPACHDMGTTHATRPPHRLLASCASAHALARHVPPPMQPASRLWITWRRTAPACWPACVPTPPPSARPPPPCRGWRWWEGREMWSHPWCTWPSTPRRLLKR